MPAGARLTENATFANRAYVTDQNFAIVDQLDAFAKERNHTILELAFSWMAARPTCASVIAGATSPEQIDANIAAVSWAMTADEIDKVDTISKK